MRVFLLSLFMIFFVSPALAGEHYICPMHSHIHGDAGDTCPICGMNLVPAGQDKQPQIKALPAGAVHIENTYRQALGVKTAAAGHFEFGKSVHAFGHVTPSTRLQQEVAVRTAGWISALARDAVGDTVKEGDLLFTFYSPDLMTAQSDYLIGARVGDVEQRLRLFGMSDKAIAELKAAGRFLEKTPFYAPASGTVSQLNAREGSYMQEGQIVMTIQDYTTVWVTAHLPLRDLALVKVGTPAVVKLDQTGEIYKAEVDFIYPEADPQSRDGMARLVIDNPEGRLKTETLVSIMFDVDSRRRLAVPEQAVLYGGAGAYVIEALGDGYFRPAMVETGITAQGMTEIVSGLAHGQEIVTSGQFMIDAESSLSGGMAAMGHDNGKQGDRVEDGDEHRH